MPLSSDSLSIAVTGQSLALYITTVNGHMDKEVLVPHYSFIRSMCSLCVLLTTITRLLSATYKQDKQNSHV